MRKLVPLKTISTTEAAIRLNISPGRVRHYIKAGQLKAVRPARDYRLDPAEVASFQLRGSGRPRTRIHVEAPRCLNCGRKLRKPDGRELCWVCSPDDSRLDRAANAARQRRADRRAAGICTECGVRRPEKGVSYCTICRKANLERHRVVAA